jgi:DNA-binding NarL/FixJ family response regulator
VKRIRVLIADDEQVLRDALRDMLSGHPRIEVIAVAGDAREAIEMARESRPDVALVDVKMPAGGGALAARGILECSPESHVVALSAYDDRAIVREMTEAGATAYVLKGARGNDLVEAILQAAAAVKA